MGESRLRLYTIWMRMKDRCYKEKCNVYKYYGGKGVTICEGWRNDFKAFKEWALSHGYNDNLSIDRIDGGKNYEPSNCRWATRMEQQSNLGWNKRYELFGEMLTAPEIARRYNLPTSIMYGRLRLQYLCHTDQFTENNYDFTCNNRRTTGPKKAPTC